MKKISACAFIIILLNLPLFSDELKWDIKKATASK